MQLFQLMITAGLSSKAKICFKIVQKFHLRVYFNITYKLNIPEKKIHQNISNL